MRVLGLLIIRESTWLARERELQRAHVEATTRLLADLPQEARDRLLERSLGLHSVKLGPALDSAALDPDDFLTWKTVARRLRWDAEHGLGDYARRRREALELLQWAELPADPSPIVDRDPGDETTTT